MRPALLLVCDRAPGAAAAALERMLAAWDISSDSHTAAAGSEDWAAVGLPPAAENEPTCGADVFDTRSDLLIWAGEMFIPPSWFEDVRESGRLERMSAAVLRRLKVHGLEAIAEIDGGFCGAWLDRRAGRWFVFNDRLGQVPLFWSSDRDRLVVAPKASLTWLGIGTPLQICEQGVADLIRTQNMCEDHTLIEGVHWLPRGNGLWWGRDGAGYCRYWDFNYQREQIEDADEALELYLERMEAAMRRHGSCRNRLMLGVSGGLDSRLFLAFAQRVGRVPDCFTSGLPFYEDVRFGRKLARVAHARHDILPLEPDGLPEALESAIIDTDGLQSAAHLTPIIPIRPYLQEHTGAVLLEGFFHGMVGGCTVPADEDVLAGKAPHQSRWARKLLHSGGDIDLINALLQPAIARQTDEEWRSRIDDTYREAPLVDPLHRAEYTMVNARRGRVDVLGTSLLRNHVLVRNPASDLQMLDWHERVSPRLRRARAVYVSVLRRSFPAYARVPRADGCGALPIAINPWLREYCWQMNRLRRGCDWLRYPAVRRWGTSSRALRAWAFDAWRASGRLDTLLEPSARILKWVRRERLTRLWNNVEVYPYYSELLLTLATLEVTLRRLELQARIQPAHESPPPISRDQTARRRSRAGEAVIAHVV